ncbi:uncharacterized protein LOC122512592 isoform X2 [Leptopilina heterotoma]|nr:uncharacterized protein LOC122512592 isoform X2 [Leptopilina heterotoma]XP_043484445.1 uncharacterized protein LOC122512592 isoform X2 [Leptopilina heterotoma]XP_043484446.1 uncharacterized protein LOC122512592 isoform X2 [Leptopilina heterotoma]
MKSFVCCLCLVASLKTISALTKPLSLTNNEGEFNNWEEVSSNENLSDNSQIDYFANDNTKSYTQTSDADLQELSRILETLLEQTGPWKAPLVVFEVPSQQIVDDSESKNIEVDEHDLKKRSRYYRRYPWKRRNSSSYDYREEQYLCMPSRKEVLKLLVALHGTRGHEEFLRTDVDFCKRHKPGGSVFTNIRFLGRRK